MSRDYKVYFDDILAAIRKVTEFTAGLRDILSHRYFEIDPDIIWDIVRNKLPLLRTQVQRILER